jgi:hypothetical protein
MKKFIIIILILFTIMSCGSEPTKSVFFPTSTYDGNI